MGPARFCFADTAIGPIGLLWTEAGVAGLALPGDGAGAIRARFARLRPGATEGEAAGAARPALAGVAALLAGEPEDFRRVPLDLGGVPPFDRRVYDVAVAIPRGETLTYGAVAARLGEAGAARAVGAALGRNPVPIIVPCHRVLAPAAGPAGSRPRAERPRSCASSRSRAPRPAGSRTCSARGLSPSVRAGSGRSSLGRHAEEGRTASLETRKRVEPDRLHRRACFETPLRGYSA